MSTEKPVLGVVEILCVERRSWFAVHCLLIYLIFLLGGCSAIPIHEQGLATKSNMGFDGSAGSALDSIVASQVEPGSGIGIGGQAAGCIACR